VSGVNSRHRHSVRVDILSGDRIHAGHLESGAFKPRDQCDLQIAAIRVSPETIVVADETASGFIRIARAREVPGQALRMPTSKPEGSRDRPPARCTADSDESGTRWDWRQALRVSNINVPQPRLLVQRVAPWSQLSAGTSGLKGGALRGFACYAGL